MKLNLSHIYFFPIRFFSILFPIFENRCKLLKKNKTIQNMYNYYEAETSHFNKAIREVWICTPSPNAPYKWWLSSKKK